MQRNNIFVLKLSKPKRLLHHEVKSSITVTLFATDSDVRAGTKRITNVKLKIVLRHFFTRTLDI